MDQKFIPEVYEEIDAIVPLTESEWTFRWLKSARGINSRPESDEGSTQSRKGRTSPLERRWGDSRGALVLPEGDMPSSSKLGWPPSLSRHRRHDRFSIALYFGIMTRSLQEGSLKTRSSSLNRNRPAVASAIAVIGTIIAPLIWKWSAQRSRRG